MFQIPKQASSSKNPILTIFMSKLNTLPSSLTITFNLHPLCFNIFFIYCFKSGETPLNTEYINCAGYSGSDTISTLRTNSHWNYPW